MFVVKADEDEEEVYGCGLNSRGQLGLGYLSHVNDCIKIDRLSNLMVKTDKSFRKVKITQIECGADHCLALSDIGSVFSWGGNEAGEQGNQKRMFSENPAVVPKFLKYRVKRVFADRTSSAVLASKE
jgi:alpha-tubulin suppressor-like RCC1 family protein